MPKRVNLGIVVVSAILAVAWLSSAIRRDLPLTVEWMGLTNISATTQPMPHWTAYNPKSETVTLTAASPSHGIVKITNRTRTVLDYRLLLYDFRAPSGQATIIQNGIEFGPPETQVFNYKPLKPGASVLVNIPRPPFDCVWRVNVAYLLPLPTLRKFLVWFHPALRQDGTEHVVDGSTGPCYDRMAQSLWVRN